MKQKQNNQSGFTIVELLIIIIVVGILGGVIFSTVSNIRRNSRNSERQNDIKTIQRSVEDYYAQNEKYPTLANLNNSAWRNKNLKTLSDDDLTDPSGKSPAAVAKPEAKVYSYAPTTTDGKDCDNSTLDCMKYVLTATQENAEPYSKNNYN